MDNLIEQIIDEESGVFAISLVSDPAIEEDFIMLSKEVKLSLNEEKRMVTGPILIPDLPIMRLTKDQEPYHIFFSKDTVEKVSQKYLADHNQEAVTLEHQVDVKDIVMVESWIKTDDTHDKTVALGVQAPTGSWVGSFKVNNDKVWEDIIKTGLVKGFSIEGLFKQKEVEQSKPKIMEKDNLLDKIKELVLGKETAPEVEMVSMEKYTELCAQVSSLEESIQSLVGKLEELTKVEEPTPEIEVEAEPLPGRNPQTDTEVTRAEDSEQEEKPEEKEAVAMIAVTDNVEESKIKNVKFDPYMTAQERIRLSITG